MISPAQVMEWAREAGAIQHIGPRLDATLYTAGDDDLARFARLVHNAALERAAEVCAKIENGRYPDGTRASGVAWECEVSIRALKEPEK